MMEDKKPRTLLRFFIDEYLPMICMIVLVHFAVLGIAFMYKQNSVVKAQTQQIELTPIEIEMTEKFQKYQKETSYHNAGEILIAEELRLIREELEKLNKGKE